LAGSAAVALLVMAAIPNPRAAVLYLFVFGAGTLAGMLLLSCLMESALLWLSRWWSVADRVSMFVTGLLSAVLGAWIVCQIVWVDSLLSAHPGWSPR
jgi:high-affinity nickel-transport protein